MSCRRVVSMTKRLIEWWLSSLVVCVASVVDVQRQKINARIGCDSGYEHCAMVSASVLITHTN